MVEGCRLFLFLFGFFQLFAHFRDHRGAAFCVAFGVCLHAGDHFAQDFSALGWVSFVAGQCKGLTEQDWAGLAGQGRTLVIYMGVSCASRIADKLMADGVAPDMPVAVLERGTCENSRAMRTLLADLGSLVEREKVCSPAIIVVGEVVLLSDAVDRLRTLAVQAETQF